jgi:hypothetical protein
VGYAGHSVYGGLYADRWFGAGGGIYESPSNVSTWALGGEFGLNFVLAGFLTIRPAIGVGRVAASATWFDYASLHAGGQSYFTSPFSSAYYQPSLTVLASWRYFFVGLDAGVVLTLAQPQLIFPPCCNTLPDLNGGLVHLQVGVKLWPSDFTK